MQKKYQPVHSKSAKSKTRQKVEDSSVSLQKESQHEPQVTQRSLGNQTMQRLFASKSFPVAHLPD